MDKDGGPAFPRIEWHPNGTGTHQSGMSLRDYFAAAALPVLIRQQIEVARSKGFVHPDNDVAKCAYECADAMLAAREKS